MTITSVYQYFNCRGHLLYIGITDRGNKRLREHSSMKDWFRYAVGCSIEHYETREEALARETYLIATYRPPFNTQHNPRHGQFIEMDKVSVPIDVSRKYVRRSKAGAAVTRRRREWYAMSKKERQTAFCATCLIRPSGIRGPECMVCHPAKSDHLYQQTP